MRRRWVVRSRPSGEPPVTLLGEVVAPVEPETVPTLIVSVNDVANVVFTATAGPVELHPVHIERVRQALAFARAAALWDRQTW